MKKYILLFSTVMLFNHCGKSQIDNLNREKASFVLEQTELKSKLSDRPFLLFSINNQLFYIIEKNKENLNAYSIRIDSNEKITAHNQSVVENPPKFLINSFESDVYHKGYVDLNSDFYKSGYEVSDGSPTYFYFSDKNGDIHGETCLTTIIKPNPISEELYGYLLVKTLSIIDKD